ncbi:hypothetical protein KDA_25720 [Dictyobacter alpinus]|uniref:SWIM-type domain-containing protein n=1 Tax=Dictyobacter alpinus TaxID=2014873 RepID=A0A402B6V8_9CHLR|nr:helicase-associated domain-containing protein [Dictyobacter alpinus]GCE27088.1 hypothetical protein KDA_25720 [Dictyobacter alpinus]
MENIVPGVLQRLRPADIIRMAGLAAASLGQEYNRTSTIRGTQRQGALLRGVVELPQGADTLVLAFDEDEASTQEPAATSLRSYEIEVELTNSTSWRSSCSCGGQGALLCAHGAALLYRWLAQPQVFESLADPTTPPTASEIRPLRVPTPVPSNGKAAKIPVAPNSEQSANVVVRYSADLSTILAQISLGELRGVAREYELVTNGLSRQQLAEAVVEAMRQPEVVRRVASTLEKAQRQLLAALALTGGMVSDDELRGLFDRFSLGKPPQLQRALLALQGKALLFRVNASPADIGTRPTGNNTLLDIGWFVPTEIRSALRVSIPTTAFDVSKDDERSGLPQVQFAWPYQVLSNLLLVARALDGLKIEPADPWSPLHPPDLPTAITTGTLPSGEHVGLAPLPPDLPSETLVETLQQTLPFTRHFLNFAVQVLLLAGLLQKPQRQDLHLRVLPDAAQLLLGSVHANVLQDLFKLWLQSSSMGELSTLRDEGLRILCRMTPLNVPVLRAGELAEENTEARQILLALLAQAPAQQWMQFAAFGRFVSRLNPLFLQRRQRLLPTPHWWLETDGGKPLKPTLLGDWQRAELLYIEHLLKGPLYWWGLCDVALSTQGRLLAFRLTDLSAWLLHERLPLSVEQPVHSEESTVAALSVQEDGQILLASTAYNWPNIQLLEQFAESVGVREGRLCYRFTPQILSQALSKGQRATRLLEMLRIYLDPSPGEPGGQLLARIEQWLASYGHIRLYTGVTMLETADLAVMRELSATTSLDEQIIRPIHPTLLVLKKAANERLSEELKRRDHSPLIHDEEVYGPE